MAPLPEWGPVFAQLGELLQSFGSLPNFARWKEMWPHLEVRRCGSTVTGLYVPGQSDLDLVLYFRGCEVVRPEQLSLLNALAHEIRTHHSQRIGRVQLIEAKAPIVQFTVAGLVVDVSVQSVLGLANSSLMARYCNDHPQLRLLARKVKEFATAWGIKSGKDGTLSSYGYTLLCTHFLQNAAMTGIDVPHLPVFPGWDESMIGAVGTENEDPNMNRVKTKDGKPAYMIPPPPPREPYFSMLALTRAVQYMPPAPEPNMAHVEPRSIVVLFAHFAAWLLPILRAGLNEDGAIPYCVSVRQGDAWSRIQSRLDRRAFLVIEEPFSGDNVARPLTYQGALKMQNAFQKAIAQLEVHPLARSLGVPSQMLAQTRQGRANDWHASHGGGGYPVDMHHHYVGAH